MPRKKRSSIGRQRKKHKKTITISSDVRGPDDIYIDIQAIECIYDGGNEDHEDEPFWRLPWLDIEDDTMCKESGKSDEVADSDGVFGHEFYVILDKAYKYHHTVNLEEFTQNLVSGVIYSRLKTQLDNSKHPDFVFIPTSRYIRYIQCYDSDDPKVKMSVTIMPDLTAEIHVHGLKLDRNHEIWNDIPLIFLTKKSLWTLLDRLKKYKVCAGNFDPEFQDFVPIGRRLEVNGSNYVAFREGDYSATTGPITYHGTIRSTKCLLLTDILRCKDCAVYRRTLKKTLERETKKQPVSQVNWLKSKKGEVRMTEVEKLQKLKQYKQYTHELETKCRKLERQISHLIQKKGVRLSQSENNDLRFVMESCGDMVRQAFPEENSFQRLFWEQQLKYSRLKDKSGMRWHPLMIKWCIFLRSKSGTTYDALRHSKFVNLPSERTLYDYSHYIKQGVGNQPEIIEHLANELKELGVYTEDWKKFVGLLQDEIKIKSDLVYDKHSGELVGFVDLENIGNQLQQIERLTTEQDNELAKYIIVIMVRGFAIDLKYPFAHFTTCGITADKLFPMLWKAVEILEVDLGLKCMFITSDGASPNRRFIRLHANHGNDDNDSIVYRALNIFSPDQRYIYFVSDVPHLIKTTRNCFSNSNSHKMTRKMWKDGKDISWLQIVDLFQDHCTGLYRVCPKLTRSHINLGPFSCMKVNFAAQILSSTVASALEVFYGDNVSETVQFIKHMNNFFDCLNVRNTLEGQRSRNENLNPYRDENDDRLQYLTGEFLQYFDDWKTSVENRQGQFTKSQKSRSQLSYQTLEGLQITVKSIVECVKYLLQNGVEYVLTERFNQDPVEQHFGIHRTRGGCNTNPNVKQFNHMMVNIRVAGSQAIAPLAGNTKRQQQDQQIGDQPLPKRQRH